MNANQKNELLRRRIAAVTGIQISDNDARILRLAESTLRRWHELQCGTDSGHVEVDDETGHATFRPAGFWHRGQYIAPASYRAPRRDVGAEKRIREVCDRNGLAYYIQTDPRGASLYVSAAPLSDRDYDHGVYCYV